MLYSPDKGYDYSVDERPGDAPDLEQSDTEVGSVTNPQVSPGIPTALSRRTRLILALVGLAVIILVVFVIAYLDHKKPSKKATNITINTQSLSAGTLQKLENQGPTNTGSLSQRLVIAPDTLFQKGLEVQGSTQLDHGLAVTGNLNLTGNLNVSGTISGASLNIGSLTINSIVLANDLTFGGHLNASGAQPTAKADAATSGGAVTISGTDTAGTVTITVGGGHLVAGNLGDITFSKAFGSTPHVELTPANNNAANLTYFVTQHPNFFSIETTTTPANGTTYQFNYFVTQ